MHSVAEKAAGERGRCRRWHRREEAPHNRQVGLVHPAGQRCRQRPDWAAPGFAGSLVLVSYPGGPIYEAS